MSDEDLIHVDVLFGYVDLDTWYEMRDANTIVSMCRVREYGYGGKLLSDKTEQGASVMNLNGANVPAAFLTKLRGPYYAQIREPVKRTPWDKLKWFLLNGPFA